MGASMQSEERFFLSWGSVDKPGWDLLVPVSAGFVLRQLINVRGTNKTAFLDICGHTAKHTADYDLSSFTKARSPALGDGPSDLGALG